MSGHVVSVTFESSMVEKLGVVAEKAAPALYVQKLVPLTVLVADIQGGGFFIYFPHVDFSRIQSF